MTIGFPPRHVPFGLPGSLGATLAALLLLAWPTYGSAVGIDVSTPGLAPLKAYWPRGATLTEDQMLRMQGENLTGANVILVIRVDDHLSTSYASRLNVEQVIPPGPFNLAVQVAGQKTASGRTLDHTNIRHLALFTGKGTDKLRFDHLEFETPEQLPAGAYGWDLGPEGTALWPGFKKLTPASPELAGAKLRGLNRPSGDALIRDGIQGIRTIRLPLPAGDWKITLWTRDQGEWEYLPHPLQRRITAQGRTVWEQSLNAGQWIERVYLAGRNREAVADGDAWETIGQRRSGEIRFRAEVIDGTLNLELAGDKPAATFLSGILAEPMRDGPSVADQVAGQRAEWFRETWRSPDSEIRIARGFEILPLATRSAGAWPGTLPKAAPVGITSGKGQWVNLDFMVASPISSSKPKVSVNAGGPKGKPFPVQTRFGHWRFQREDGASTLLVARADHLRGDLEGMRLRSGVPRRVNLRVWVPPDTPAGEYVGALNIHTGILEASQTFTIRVLDARLPEPDRPVGVYLDAPPHLVWFPEYRDARLQQQACDMQLLHELGLTGIAPPMVTPDARGRQEFLGDLQRARDAGFNTPAFAYAPVKRLVRGLGEQKAAEVLLEIESEILARNLIPPIWAIADEPGAPHNHQKNPLELARTLRAEFPKIRLAGQLNRPRDRKYLDAFDTVLINHGFGADLATVSKLKKRGLETWLYNIPRMRLAAGFFNWRTGAQGYLQWHGRMPTADPFDPTDGREDDFQFLYPAKTVCAANPDLDGRLLQITEGITDLRWLLWLESKAPSDPNAQWILEILRDRIPTDWKSLKTLPDEAADEWRAMIQSLARKLDSRQDD